MGSQYLGPAVVVWAIHAGGFHDGFFPGVIFYLTFWFTNKYRAKMVAMFMTGIPLSGALTGPISGWILARMSGVGHLHAWQWLFLVEGIPSLLAGLLTLAYLTDNHAKAAWLNEREKRMVLDNLHAEEELKKRTGPWHHKLPDAFRSVDVWILAFIVVTSALNVIGLKVADRTNFVLMTVQLLILALFVILSITHLVGHSQSLVSTTPFTGGGGFSALAAGAAVAAYSFLGFDAISTLTEESYDAERNVPRAIVLVALIGGGIFIVVTYFVTLV